ncbi:hypothetical protein HPB52_006849 [Rhipicephalus sanguineus]|uniref:RING-type domain-containing protein n=1 Tax=Rhipicephalus sanguineus TaxID=34632 RepID=A0A9D4QDG0_RHISA|nr:hypothetical protein HPB52_006849 [Rhipicephalus sanguineus]
MPDLQRVHRFRDHAVAGVNWRPTRFVDEVPSLRVCGLCRMIPRKTVLLPCKHFLCQSCHAANRQGRGGRCPLDQEPFGQANCTTCDFANTKANVMKVHCWNEVHGCKFTGVMKLMLRHYENECTFHAVECLRCGEQVLHRELSTHYVAGCNAAVSSPRAGNASSDSQALTLQDCTAAFEELKMLLRDGSHEHLLLAIQSQMNGLIEQIRHQESKLAVITRAVAAPSASEMAQVEASSSRTSLQAGTSEQNPTEKASTSSTSRSCSEETLMSRQLVPLVDLPREGKPVCRYSRFALERERSTHVSIHTAMPDLRRVHRFRDHAIAGVNWRPTRFVEEVYCWNESHGREYEGAMEDMLLHYENECTFHSLECLRCGESVLHRELATHYVAGCSTRLSSARTENTSSESRALTLQDVKNALEEVKMLLRDPNHDQLLPAIQSQVNELTEQVRNQESRNSSTRGHGSTDILAGNNFSATSSVCNLYVVAPLSLAGKADRANA